MLRNLFVTLCLAILTASISGCSDPEPVDAGTDLGPPDAGVDVQPQDTPPDTVMVPMDAADASARDAAVSDALSGS